MRYVLDKNYRLRGYKNLPTGLHDITRGKTTFFTPEQYRVVLDCDGLHDLDAQGLNDGAQELLRDLAEEGIIHPAAFAETISDEQLYLRYPVRYTRSVHWSITGNCNLRCRHCFMSAPEGKHGAPSWEQLAQIVDQLDECGVHAVGLTGGEPLVREDFYDLLDLLCARQIVVNIIYTNGWLVDGELLDALEARRMHPAFQLSYDGVGRHDFLRGVEGAEQRCMRALKLLQERDYAVSVSMCLHRGNIATIRQTVNLMASLGVRSMKISPAFELGDWAQSELRALYLSRDETLETIEAYIPQFFEDDAPLDLIMDGAFCYESRGNRWYIGKVDRVSEADEAEVSSCGVLKKYFYIGATGSVAPCMAMDDCAIAETFPNLFENPLKEILAGPAWAQLTDVTVGQVRDANPKCRKCRFKDRCAGGCRYHALLQSDDYMGVASELCHFFAHGWDERIRAAAEPAYADFCARHPELQTSAPDARPQQTDSNGSECA